MKRSGRIRHMGTLHAALILLVRIAGLSAAALWRRLMVRTTFVAITGSVGKTTAKECIAAALATRYRVASTFGSQNHFYGIFRTLFRVRPWHRYAVVEIGLDGPGQMKWFARVVKPDIAVWIGAARAHTDRFKSLEQTAAEKSLLVRAVRPPGWAVLNIDNPYSAACVPPPGVRAIRFGTDESADVRAVGAASAWPDRLSFELLAGGESFPVRTRLIGTHWTPSVLAGFAVAQACGIGLSEAAEAIEKVEPTPVRLSPEPTPNGAVFLRDERNGSIDTLDPAIRVMAEARARRRVLIISDISDDKRTPRRRSRALGRLAAGNFEVAVFLGENARRAVEAAVEAGMPQENAHAFTAIEEAARFVREAIREGDLVLLKGRHTDHMSRLYLTMVRDVTCWRDSCKRHGLCDQCPDLARGARAD